MIITWFVAIVSNYRGWSKCQKVRLDRADKISICPQFTVATTQAVNSHLNPRERIDRLFQPDIGVQDLAELDILDRHAVLPSRSNEERDLMPKIIHGKDGS